MAGMVDNAVSTVCRFLWMVASLPLASPFEVPTRWRLAVQICRRRLQEAGFSLPTVPDLWPPSCASHVSSVPEASGQ